jgi:polyphosphate kinase
VAHALVHAQYALYNDSLMPAFAKAGVRILSHSERNADQRNWVKELFLNVKRGHCCSCLV